MNPFQIFSAGTLLADRLGQCAIGDSPLKKRRALRTLVLLRTHGNRACRYYAGYCRNGVRTRDLKVMSLASYQLLYPAIRPRTLQTLVLLHVRSIRTCRYYGGDFLI